jgi:hypothetical protein
MKKKGVMRRHYSEGKTDLKTGIRVKSSFVLFLLFSHEIFSQIPVNGFCDFKSFQVPPGYENFVPSDINKDNFPDFILFSPDKKEFAYAESDVSESLTYSITKNKILFEISTMLNVRSTLHSNPFVFTSRKNRLMGMCDIPSIDKLDVLFKMEFDSYPENISRGDINKNGRNEYLISGSGFDGLSIIFRDVDRFGERKIISGVSYGKAQFIDLSGDGYLDVLAYNLVERSFQFFYNNSYGDFELIRTIKVGEILSNILPVDINKDGYSDIIFADHSGINIIYGDPESRYAKRTSLQTDYLPHLIVTADFNNDKIPDLAYIDKNQGVLSIIYGVRGGKFYDEIIYTKKPSLSDLKIIRQNSNDALALLSKEGWIYIISVVRQPGLTKFLNLVPAVDPSAIRIFDKGNNNIKDICFIDQSDNTLTLFINNPEYIPENYYSIPLADSYNEIKTDETFPDKKTFYCYSNGSSLIEILRIDFIENEINKKQLYAPGPIEDLNISRVDSSLVNVYITYKKSNKLHIGKYEHHDLSITFKEYPAIDLNTFSARLVLADEPNLYYWKETQETLRFTKAEIKTGPNQYIELLSLPKSDEMQIITFAEKTETIGDFIVSIIISEKNSFAVVSDGFKADIFSPYPDNFSFKPENNFTLFRYNDNSEDKYKLMVYLQEGKSLSIVEFLEEEKYFKIAHIFNADNVFDYYLDTVDSSYNQFIFSNKKESCISIIRLEK